ncbi:hypothetical protein DKX38_014204 [Salix brachista]|uniref:Rhodopsin n=1 Tax=Salix brachista TaxID=2182728 RepID=A0A5N5LF05_9ROSI|nr:hypothetical protein DKX38_014204 [Salix brachista]
MSYYNQQQPPVGVPPPQGYPPEGYPKDAYPPQGYPPQGYPPQGYPPQGYPPQGYPPPYAPQYGQPPNQHQGSSGPGCMEGCCDGVMRAVIVVSTYNLSCATDCVVVVCDSFGCPVLLLSPGCLLLMRGKWWDDSIEREKWEHEGINCQHFSLAHYRGGSHQETLFGNGAAEGRLEWINSFVASFTFLGPTSPFARHLPGRETSATELAGRGFIFSVLSALLCNLVFAPVFFDIKS